MHFKSPSDSTFNFQIAGIIKLLCGLLFRRMCKNFKLSRRCNKKSSCFFQGQGSVKRFQFPERSYFKRTRKHLRSDQEICIPTAREAMQPIYVSEITRNFPSEILMPFVSARHELGEINLLGNLDNRCLSDSQLSMDCTEEDVAEIFAWVYSMDITEDNLSNDISDASVREN